MYQEIVTLAPDSEDVDESEEAIGIDDDNDSDAPMPFGIKGSVRKVSYFEDRLMNDR
jgi:hypothetical protein